MAFPSLLPVVSAVSRPTLAKARERRFHPRLASKERTRTWGTGQSDLYWLSVEWLKAMMQPPEQLEKSEYKRWFVYLLVWSAPYVCACIANIISGILSHRPNYHPYISGQSFGFLYGLWTAYLYGYFGKWEKGIEERQRERENICAFCKQRVSGKLVYSMQYHASVCVDCLPPPAS
jgi:hypothetical protein